MGIIETKNLTKYYGKAKQEKDLYLPKQKPELIKVKNCFKS